MRKKSLPRKSSNRPLREPNRGFQRRDGALLLARQLAVVVVTQQHGAVAPVEIGFHPHGGGLAADLALFSGHADAPVEG
jgi:hypothetical protein